MAVTINASTSSGVITTADNSGALQLQTNNGTTAMTIDTSQNVGIGTASPATKLQVTTASGTSSSIRINQTSNGDWQIYNPASSTDLRLYDGTADRVTFATGGNVGIGTASPGQRLDVSGSTTSDIYRLRSNQTAPSSTDAFIYRPADNTIALGTNSTERMRIDSNGWTYINCTSNVSAANAYQNILFNGDLYYGQAIKTSKVTTGSAFSVFVNSAGTTSGSITHNGTTTTAFNTSSDYRLKENIAPMTGALDKVSALKPVTYTWKADGSDGQGFIAHELAEVVRDCVYGEKDAVDAEGNPIHQGVDTSFLVATLTAAIQEQQTIITELKSRIEALEGAK